MTRTGRWATAPAATRTTRAAARRDISPPAAGSSPRREPAPLRGRWPAQTRTPRRRTVDESWRTSHVLRDEREKPARVVHGDSADRLVLHAGCSQLRDEHGERAPIAGAGGAARREVVVGR